MQSPTANWQTVTSLSKFTGNTKFGGVFSTLGLGGTATSWKLDQQEPYEVQQKQLQSHI